MEWIRKAIRSCSFLVHEETASQSDGGIGSSSYQVTLRRWLFGQRNYFEGATRRDQKRMESQEKRVFGLFLAGIVLATIGVVVDSGPVLHVEKIGHDLLILSMVLVPAIAAAIDGYGEKMAVSAQAKKYEQMHGIFSRAAEYLQRLLDMKDYASAQELIRELGREALMENGDWVLMHRDRPMKIPVGG